MGRVNKREEILDFIQKYISQYDYGPSVREIGEAVGLSSTATVYYHLRALTQAGELSMENGKKRAISLPKHRNDPEASGQSADFSPDGMFQGAEPGPGKKHLVPLVGTVAAGQPILAVENVEGYLPWEGGEGWFALRVRGESMKNAGILPGDKVVVRPQATAENGEIVVALLGDEATVKRFSRQNGHVWLLPENEAYDPIDGDEAVILGLVRGVVREYG